MAEAFYKVGDILELDGNASFPRQFGMFPKDAKIRCMVLKCIKPGYEFIIYTLLVYKIDGSFDTVGINQKDIAIAAKRVGHIDISSFLSDEESAEPDYAMLFAVGTIAQSIDLKNENEKLKAENKALSDTLSKSEAKAQSRLDRNEVLKRENEELRGYNKELEQALSESEAKAQSRLDEIAFLMRKVDELENVRDKLKVERDEANHEIDRLRTVVGGLNDVIDDLNASKSEISDLFCSLKNALQTNDILEGVNELKKENERLSNAQRYLDLSNENRELKAEYFACTEKIKELEDENVRYLQSMTCVEKQLNEAMKRIHTAMEHLDVAFCDNE